jgi:hypothetical protein
VNRHLDTAVYFLVTTGIAGLLVGLVALGCWLFKVEP